MLHAHNITDVAFVRYLAKQKLLDHIPAGPQRRMAAAHIIPFPLNEFGEKELRGAARTWDMFISWTNIDIQKLAGDKINSPENAIFMTADDRISFGQFRIYFDKEAYPAAPNKYMVRMTGYVALSNGQALADVEFQTQAGVEPPNLVYLRAHAAFARVLHLCGAADYVDIIE